MKKLIEEETFELTHCDKRLTIYKLLGEHSRLRKQLVQELERIFTEK